MLSNRNNTYKFLLPNLLEIQRASYCWFLEKGLVQELDHFSTIKDYLGELELNFATKFYVVKQPKYNLNEARRLDTTYSVRIFINAKLNYSTGIDSQYEQVFLGDVPLMTNEGTFLVNGIERVIINQIVRSPGIYYNTEVNRQGTKTYGANLISNRGTWIKFDVDKDDFIAIKIDKAKKFSAYIFLRALGLEDQEILENIDNTQYFRLTSQFDESLSQADCLLKIHSYLRPEESPTVKGCQQLLYSKFFDPKRYDLGFIGRYKINQRLGLNIEENIHILTSLDVLYIVNQLINFRNISIQSDDIDHLGNRRIRSIGELLVNQVRVGLNRLERITLLSTT